MNTLVWLVSYPKSGNTWMRLLLANYLSDSLEAVDINNLNSIFNASSRWLFDMLAGFSSARFPSDSVDSLRPPLYRYYANLSHDLKLLNAHEAFRTLVSGEPLFPSDVSRGVVYIVRNPLDVVISYAHHRDAGFDDTIAHMNDPLEILAPDNRRLDLQFPQWLGTWSNHVAGWIACPSRHRVHVVRYEDLLANTKDVLAGIVRFIGLPVNTARLELAVQFSSFENLRRQEQEHPFLERKGTSNFFRYGRAGAGLEELTSEQTSRVIKHHGSVMRQLGYLSDRC
jgi:aryl sulfotransferase